ncbi:MAG: winged helix-turn-helix domain-containing protein [Alphaproteobacteria bacterium]
MNKIYFDTENKLLFETIKSIFEDIGFCEVINQPSQNLPILKENKNNFTIGKFTFQKPLYIKDIITKNIFENTFSFSNFLINKQTRKISYDKNSTTLTQTELNILEILYKSKNGISLDEILKDVLDYSSISQSKTSATHIYNLRKKLNMISGLSNIIIFENNKYKLNKN